MPASERFHRVLQSLPSWILLEAPQSGWTTYERINWRLARGRFGFPLRTSSQNKINVNSPCPETLYLSPQASKELAPATMKLRELLPTSSRVYTQENREWDELYMAESVYMLLGALRAGWGDGRLQVLVWWFGVLQRVSFELV
jgi:hypothetical protein